MIVDAAFLDAGQREPFARLAEESACAHCWLACEAPVPVLRARVAKRDASGRDASEAGPDVLGHQLENYHPMTSAEETRTVHIDTLGSWSGERLVESIEGKTLG